MFNYILLFLIAVANYVPGTHAIDWSGVEDRFRVIRDGAFPTGFANIVDMALEENIGIGGEIAEMVTQAEIEAYAILDRAFGSIAAQNLTRDVASEILYDYVGRVSDLHDEIAENVQSLSDPIRETWGNMYYFYNFYDSWTYTQIFYLLLDQPLVDIDWSAAVEDMEYMSSVVSSEVSYIKGIAYTENSEIGDAVTPILDAAFDVTITRFDWVLSLIRNQTWTLAEAVQFFADYNNRDSTSAVELEPYFSQLSDDAFWSLLTMAHETDSKIHGVALAIYDNIGQVDFFRCCLDTRDRHEKLLNKLRKFKGANKKYMS